MVTRIEGLTHGVWLAVNPKLLVYTTVLGSHAEHNQRSTCKHRMTDWFDGLPLVAEQGTRHASASCLAVRRTNISTSHSRLGHASQALHVRAMLRFNVRLATGTGAVGSGWTV